MNPWEREVEASLQIDANQTLEDAALDREPGWMNRLLKVREAEREKPRLGQTWYPRKEALHGAYWHAVESGARLEGVLVDLRGDSNLRHPELLAAEIEAVKAGLESLISRLQVFVIEDL